MINIRFMILRILAIALVASACGEVTAPLGSLYKGTMTQTQPVMFGGGTGICTYAITLKQLEIELEVLPSRQVTSGHVQDLNVETTDASCSHPVIPENIASYTLASATPLGGGESLAFQGQSTNAPAVSLVGMLKPANSGYTAELTFQRTDAPDAVLAWTVTVTLTLSPQ